MTTRNDIYQALFQKCGYEMVIETEEPNRLRIMGRIRLGNDGRNMGNWQLVMHRLLKAAFRRPWTIDISKDFFIKTEDSPLVFGWRIILQGENVAQYFADVVNIIQTAPATARTEVTEMPMPGSKAHRNSTAGGARGAGASGSVPVGPLAVAQKNAGG